MCLRRAVIPTSRRNWWTFFRMASARNLTDGILRVRYRDSLESPKLMTPGEVYKMTIDAGVTSNVFLAGAPDPGGDFEQQFPAVRPQSEYGRRGGG